MGVSWWQIWWQIRGQRGMSGDTSRRRISILLIHLPFLSGSLPVHCRQPTFLRSFPSRSRANAPDMDTKHNNGSVNLKDVECTVAVHAKWEACTMPNKRAATVNEEQLVDSIHAAIA